MGRSYMGTHFLRGAVRLGLRIARANIECRLSAVLVQQCFFSFRKQINLRDKDELSIYKEQKRCPPSVPFGGSTVHYMRVTCLAIIIYDG